MDDLIVYGFFIILFLGIVYSLIASIVNKIKEPTEAEERLINLKEEKEKYSKLSKEAEEKIHEAEASKREAESQIHAAKVEENRYIALKENLIARYNKAMSELSDDKSKSTFEESETYKDKYEKLKETFDKELTAAKNEVANAVGKRKQYFSELILAKEEMKRQFAFHPALVTPFLEGIDKQRYYESIMQGVLQHSFDNPPLILKIDIYARIHSTTSDMIYRTTLDECSCKDNGCRHRPCKHMLYLAYLLGLLQIDQKAQREATEIYNDLGVEIAELKASISKEREKHKKLQAVNIEVQNAINEVPNAYPRIAGMMSDLVALQFKDSELYLRCKHPPAHKSADEVSRMREKARSIEKRNKELEYKMETLEKWFPNINDVFNKDFKVDMWELETREPSAKEIKDYISKHLNSIKYNNLR